MLTRRTVGNCGAWQLCVYEREFKKGERAHSSGIQHDKSYRVRIGARAAPALQAPDSQTQPRLTRPMRQAVQQGLAGRPAASSAKQPAHRREKQQQMKCGRPRQVLSLSKSAKQKPPSLRQAASQRAPQPRAPVPSGATNLLTSGPVYKYPSSPAARLRPPPAGAAPAGRTRIEQHYRWQALQQSAAPSQPGVTLQRSAHGS